MKDERLWQTFSRLVETVWADHAKRGALGGAHNPLHASMVAQYGVLISGSPWLRRCSFVAGICHNVDRIYREDKALVAKIVSGYLETASTLLSLRERILILKAVLEHSKKNDPNDNLVTVALKDADRLANLGPLHWIRAGQFRPNIPPVDPRFITDSDPTATFRDPKSVLQDIKNTLEWESWLRLPKAKELGKPMFDEIRRFIANVEQQFETLGLLPFPEELVVENPEN
ncbi:MAG: hypothetical protein Q7R88_02225 [bacterium]|nr:hypothetical protein [bacterium]